jgi:hypothetical protein
MDDELNLDEIDAILAQPEPAVKTSRTKRKDHEDRTVKGWFALLHESHDCTVPDHDMLLRPRNKGMTVKINDYYVCRICFLSGTDLNG